MDAHVRAASRNESILHGYCQSRLYREDVPDAQASRFQYNDFDNFTVHAVTFCAGYRPLHSANRTRTDGHAHHSHLSNAATASRRGPWFANHPVLCGGCLVVRLLPAELLHIGLHHPYRLKPKALVQSQASWSGHQAHRYRKLVCLLTSPGKQLGARSTSVMDRVGDEETQFCTLRLANIYEMVK